MTESGNPVGQVADCLLNIEMELRQLGLWESEPPPDEAFQIAQPLPESMNRVQVAPPPPPPALPTGWAAATDQICYALYRQR